MLVRQEYTSYMHRIDIFINIKNIILLHIFVTLPNWLQNIDSSDELYFTMMCELIYIFHLVLLMIRPVPHLQIAILFLLESRKHFVNEHWQ